MREEDEFLFENTPKEADDDMLADEEWDDEEWDDSWEDYDGSDDAR